VNRTIGGPAAPAAERGEPTAASPGHGKPDARCWPAWVAIGSALTGLQAAMLHLSPEFAYGASLVDYPIAAFMVLFVSAGAVYLLLAWLVPRTATTSALLAWVLAVGLVMRLLMLPSTPILADDYYRYLWDGGVASSGIDPYRYSPAEALVAAEAKAQDSARSALGRLAVRSGTVVERVNYPNLRTPYPPLAQAAFAAAHAIGPWSLVAWRSVLLALDVVTVWLLYLVLKRTRRSPLWLALYWWSPLVVKEFFNSAHMDGLLPPLLVGALLLALLGRRITACACLGLATAVKLWPVLLMPVVIRSAPARSRELVGASAIGLATVLGLAYWVHGHLAPSDSGLGAYLSGWRMNDALFGAIRATTDGALQALGYAWTDPGRVTRALVAAALAGLSLWVARAPASSARQLATRWTVIVACLLFLSPAQFPWYYAWLVPVLVLVPNVALLLATVLVSLYYLRFHLDARDRAWMFDAWIVWLEFAPVWILLARQWLLHRRRATGEALPAGSA